MDRAPDFGSGGCEFESCRGYHRVISTGCSWAAGGTGRRARLRGVWGNPSGFESRVAHHSASDATAFVVSARKPGIDVPIPLVSARKHACSLYERGCTAAGDAQSFRAWRIGPSSHLSSSSSKSVAAYRTLSSRVPLPVGCTVSTYRRSTRLRSQSSKSICRTGRACKFVAPLFPPAKWLDSEDFRLFLPCERPSTSAAASHSWKPSSLLTWP